MSTEEDDLIFLNYFINSYIFPYKEEMPWDKETYEARYSRSAEIWEHLYVKFNDLPLTDAIKQKMIALFEYADEIWLKYLDVSAVGRKKSYVYFRQIEFVQTRWPSIQRLAREITDYAQNEKYI